MTLHRVFMQYSERGIEAEMPGKTGKKFLLSRDSIKGRGMINDRPPEESREMLTTAPRRAHSFTMVGGKYRAFVLIACFAVTFVAVLAAMTAPASAHAGGPHADVQSASPDVASGDAGSADICCHQSGTCVAQVLPVGPAIHLLNTAPTALFPHVAAVRAASLASTTDPPPPRA